MNRVVRNLDKGEKSRSRKSLNRQSMSSISNNDRSENMNYRDAARVKKYLKHQKANNKLRIERDVKMEPPSARNG